MVDKESEASMDQPALPEGDDDKYLLNIKICTRTIYRAKFIQKSILKSR